VPVKVDPTLLNEWGRLPPAVSESELIQRYAIFTPDVDYILSFIESGAPRGRRGKNQPKMKKIREESGINICVLCNANLIDIAGECRYDWDLRTVEHVISLDWGGGTNPENSVIICKSCNEAFDHMITGVLPGRITLNKHGGKKKIKNDARRKRIRTPEQIASLPANWKSIIHLQYIFQRLAVLSTELVKRDFSEHWERFVVCKLSCIAGANKSMLKLDPSYIPREFSGF